jgi:hypothetical protein
MIKRIPRLKSLLAQTMLTGPKAMFELIETARASITPENAIARARNARSTAEKLRRTNGVPYTPHLKKEQTLADQIYSGLRLAVNDALGALRDEHYITKITGDDYQRWTLTDDGRAFGFRMMERESQGFVKDKSPKKGNNDSPRSA